MKHLLKAALLADLKACSTKRDLLWGRRIHAKAVVSWNESHILVLMALIKMYAKCGSMSDAHRLFHRIQKPNVVSWNVLLLGYAENGAEMDALELFSSMKVRGYLPDSVTYLATLKACTSLAVNGDGGVKLDILERGRHIHTEIGHHLTHFVQNTLVDMYAKCGSMADARQAFENIEHPDVVSWNALLLGYTRNGEWQIALDLFYKMKANGCAPDPVTYVAAVKACAALAASDQGSGKAICLQRGQEIHSEIGRHLDLYVQSVLIDMYTKCGCMLAARSVFDSIRKPDVVCWTALLLGYAENGEGNVALDLFFKMKARGVAPNSVTYIAVLKACACLAMNGAEKADCLKLGMELHSEIGRHLDHSVKNTLIDMYAKCDSMVDARTVFDSIPKPDVVSWNVLLLGYADNGYGDVVLDLFSQMKASGCAPDTVVYVSAIKACASLAANGDETVKWNCLQRGREIHSEIGVCSDQHLQSTLVDMYAKCGDMVEARRTFDSIERPDVVSWTALLLGYADSGEGYTALDLFSKMKALGCMPDSVTYVAAVKACASLAVNRHASGRQSILERGRDIHVEIGCHLTRYVQNTLIDMYVKCGSMVEARSVFDGVDNPDVVSWSALLSGYAENGEGHVCLELFSRMKDTGCVPNSATYVAALKACSLVDGLAIGRKLHSEIGELTPPLVTCLIDFYAKCGSMTEAREVFDLHPAARGVPAWNALLAGYGSFGDVESVFRLFEAMKDEGFQPSASTFVCVLLCCSHAGLVEKAREYFEAMVKHEATPNVMHYTCVVDVLGRANQLNEAIALLRRMPCNPDGVVWTAVLSACCKWRNVDIGRMAFESLVAMVNEEASTHVLMAQIYETRVWKLLGHGCVELHAMHSSCSSDANENAQEMCQEP